MIRRGSPSACARVVVLILLAAGGWMLETLKDFTRYLFTLM